MYCAALTFNNGIYTTKTDNNIAHITSWISDTIELSILVICDV